MQLSDSLPGDPVRATLRIILEQINKLQESLYLVFIDYLRAYDHLNHENMWEALRRKGLPKKITGLI